MKRIKDMGQMKTADLKFLELCSEIDYWMEEAQRWKQEYDKLNQQNWADHLERQESVNKDIGNALRLALSLKDDGNGNLLIDKDDRAHLSKNWK